MAAVHVRRKKPRHAENPRITGVAGAGRGTGTTHLCVLAANYLRSGRGRGTAALEWNSHGDFARFGRICAGSQAAEGRYRIQDVDYYPEAGSGTLADCLHNGYEEILIDFGSLGEQPPDELLRCHRVILTVSFSEWQAGAFWGSETWEERALKNGWLCLAAFGSEESRFRWNRRRGLTVERIPFSADAFTVTEQMMGFLGTIL